MSSSVLLPRFDDLPVQGKRVLVRASLNTPLAPDGSVADDFRLLSGIPTIQALQTRAASVILMGHLGRPGGKKAEELSFRGVARRLSELLGTEVPLVPLEQADEAVSSMRSGSVILLENLRFHPGEEENDPAFARRLASFGDAFVNDALSASHRAHASIVGIPPLLPSAAGYLFEKELAGFARVLDNSARPFLVIVGGKKADTKLAFIDRMSERADAVLVGNLLAREAAERGISFLHPERVTIAPDGVPKDRMLDIGPASRRIFADRVRNAGTVVWTGPLGKFEEEAYAKGSLEIVQAVRDSSAYAVAGGGDLVAFLRAYGAQDAFDIVSTAGGAMLAFLSGEDVPGVSALQKSMSSI